MSGLSLPVSRSTGQALLVAAPAGRGKPMAILRDLGFGTTETEDPYTAMTELCRRPLVYRAVILSLASLYQEELAILPAIKIRFPHIELWLAYTDGRQVALAEAMRLGADGVLSDDGLHRLSPPGPAAALAIRLDESSEQAPTAENGAHDIHGEDPDNLNQDDGPLLTAEELQALLHEQTPAPRSSR